MIKRTLNSDETRQYTGDYSLWQVLFVNVHGNPSWSNQMQTKVDTDVFLENNKITAKTYE